MLELYNLKLLHLSKDQDIPIKPGDKVAVGTPGGGGFGNPLERNVNLVLRDVQQGYYTVEEARQLFGVTIKNDITTIEKQETTTLRKL